MPMSDTVSPKTNNLILPVTATRFAGPPAAAGPFAGPGETGPLNSTPLRNEQSSSFENRHPFQGSRRASLLLSPVYLISVRLFRTAMATAFFVPTRITSLFPRVTAV